MLKKISLSFIYLYQGYIKTFVKCILPAHCRFTPSCSEYAEQAVLKYGFLKGVILTAKRLLACHPFSGKAGYDPLA